MGRRGKLALVLNEYRNDRHAEVRRAYKRRAHRIERRMARKTTQEAA